MTYTFHIDVFTRRGETHVYDVLTFKAEGPTMEDALKLIEAQIPAGRRVWCWHSDEKVPDESP